MGVLKEYLVRLGLQDDMTANLDKSLNQAGTKASRFAGSFGKQFLFAGIAVATMTASAGLAIGNFIGKLMTADGELNKFAKDLGVSREEAYKTKSALDVMGKSMDEVAADPRLLEQFKELRTNAENIQIPDMSKGLEKVRGVTTEFLKLKQTAMVGLQWVGHYLLKYIDKPLQDVKKSLGGINETLSKNLPQWAEKIGKALSWIVRLGATLIRVAGIAFNAIKRIFDMIPDKVKMVMGVLAALALFIRAGPLGKLIMIFSLLMLLVDDFFTYLDGGESLLGGFWQKCIDIWDALNKQGGVIEKLKESFESAMQAISRAIDFVIGWIQGLWLKLQENQAIENFGNAFHKVGEVIGKIFRAAWDIVTDLFGGLEESAEILSSFLAWLIGAALPGTIGLIADIADGVATLVQWLNELGLTKPLILAVVGAFVAFKTIKFVTGLIDGITKSILGATETINSLKSAQGSIQNLVNAFSRLKIAVTGYTTAVWKSITASAASIKVKLIEKAETLYLQALYAKDAVIRGISTAAQWAQTAATTAWNIAAGIATTVTTAFGAAIAFLTSPIGLVVLAVVALIAIVALLIKNWDKVKEFFIGLWGKIKDVFSGIGSWFKEKFTQAREGAITAFISVVAWFAEVWQKIKDVFSGGDGFFSQIAGTWFRGIEAAFGIIVDWFKTIWENIKLVFSVVKSVLTGDFQGAYDGIIQIWENIVGFFTKLVSRITSVFEPLITWLLGKFGKVGEVIGSMVDRVKGFFGGGDDNPNPKPTGGTPAPSGLPGHDDGGIFGKEHIARFAEKDKPEAVVPLTKPSRAKEVLGQVVNFLGDGHAPDDKTNTMVDKMKTFIDQASSSMRSMNQMATAGAAASAVSNSSIVNDNRQFDMSSSFKVYESNNPEATAKAIDRMQELRIRNNKGVIQ